MFWKDKRIVWKDKFVAVLSVKDYNDLNQFEVVVTIRHHDLDTRIKERIMLPGDSLTTLLELLEDAKEYRGQEQQEHGDEDG